MTNGNQMPQTPPPPPPVGPAGPPPKKGLPALAWVGIGCGAIVILLIVVLAGLGWWGVQKAKQAGIDPELMQKQPGLAAVKMMVAANPELEMVKVDEEDGIATVRNKKTGDLMTVNLKDAAKGKVSFSSGGKEMSIEASGEGKTGSVKISGGEEGNMTFGAGSEQQVPEWVPLYPGTEPKGGFFVKGKAGVRGSFQLETGDDAETILDYYRKALEDGGFSVTVNTFTEDGATRGGMVSGEETGTHRSVQVGVTFEEGSSSITVSYSEGEE